MIGHHLIGSGKEKVLVLHNWFSDSTSFSPMHPYLDPENFTYLFADLRGYGQSKSLKGSHTLEEACQDALDLTRSLNWDSFHIIGHSMSGMIAQKIAIDNPTKVKSVIALTPVPACGSKSPPEVTEFLKQAALGNDANAIEAINLITNRKFSPHIAKSIIDHWRACSTPEARVGYLDMFTHNDFSQSAQGCPVPMLVLHAEYDYPGTLELFRNTFLKWYSNPKLEICEASGHFPPQEVPIALATTIETFLIHNRI